MVMKYLPVVLCAVVLLGNGVTAQKPSADAQETQEEKPTDSAYINEEQNQASSLCDANTQEIINKVEDVMDKFQQTYLEKLREYKRMHSEELRSIISEISSDLSPLGTFSNPAPSCKEVYGSSGNYWIQNAGTGYASLQYCDMNRRCCDSTGGWMRVAFLDMTKSEHHCPVGFRSISSPKRSCGQQRSGCYSTTYAVDDIKYSRVCGRIKAYSYRSPDGFWPYNNNRARTIDDQYVDGISLTHGRSPRKHIWTFAGALDETRSDDTSCPCITNRQFTGRIPSFVGQDYFCDTGSRIPFRSLWYTNDPLWDGRGCGGTNTCCQFNNPPWFCKQLPQATTDDIELRLCIDQGISDEEIAIEVVEIFVQ